MVTSTGNLPLSNNVAGNATTNFFNNFFVNTQSISSNTNDAIVGFFESITGERESAQTLAATIIYTSQTQGINPMEVIEEFRKLSSRSKNKIKVRTPYYLPVITEYNSYTEIDENKTNYASGQLFYIKNNNLFYKLMIRGLAYTVESADNYEADYIAVTGTSGYYNYFSITYSRDVFDLNAYLTMFLNLTRVNTSQVGISNTPAVNKYISRAILA